jgi:hypothetical protein
MSSSFLDHKISPLPEFVSRLSAYFDFRSDMMNPKNLIAPFHLSVKDKGRNDKTF